MLFFFCKAAREFYFYIGFGQNNFDYYLKNNKSTKIMKREILFDNSKIKDR